MYLRWLKWAYRHIQWLLYPIQAPWGPEWLWRVRLVRQRWVNPAECWLEKKIMEREGR